MRHDAALALLVLGVAASVFGAVGVAVLRSPYDRLHFLTPVTSLGAPLLGGALVVEDGFGFTGSIVVLTVVVLALSGPVLAMATARLAAQHDGIVPPEELR